MKIRLIILNFSLLAFFQCFVNTAFADSDVTYPKTYKFGTKEVKVTNIFRFNPLSLSFTITNATGLEGSDLITNCETKSVYKTPSNEYISYPSDSRLGDIILEICSEAVGAKLTISLSQAKKQCIEMGHKAGTEKFGKCVLELSK